MYIDRCCHYDNSFDPRFSTDGHHLKVEKYPPKSLINRIYRYVKELFADILEKMHLSKPSLFKKQLKAVIKTEWQLSQTLQENVASRLFWFRGGNNIFYYDNAFFEQTGDLWKMLSTEKDLPNNPFPAELLRPLYYINAPQNKEDQKGSLRPDQIHRDISACQRLGFIRLESPNQKTYGDAPHLRAYLVSNYTFIHDTDPVAQRLKLETRKWRKALIEADRMLEAGKPEEEIKAFIVERINAFRTAWTYNVESHELLSEVYEVLSEQNFFKDFHYTDYCTKPHFLDIYNRCKQLWRSWNMGNIISESEKAYNALKNAFVRRAEKGSISGRVNKTALLFQQQQLLARA